MIITIHEKFGLIFFLGEWVADKKEGFGKFTWANGNKYEGQWSKNQQTGRGMNLKTNKQCLRYSDNFLTVIN